MRAALVDLVIQWRDTQAWILPSVTMRIVMMVAIGVLATGGTDARFVSVTVRPVALNTILPASFFGGVNAVTAGASAVAGFDQVVCQAMPLFVCNPYEVPGMSYEQASGELQAAAAD